MSESEAKPTSEGSWHLVPTEAPKVLRHCPRCGRDQPFESSDRFRVNGNGSRVDVWLIYKCVECEETWKLTLYTRVRPREIPKELFDGFQNNDAAIAWRYAFDEPLIRRNGAELSDSGAFEVEGTAREALSGLARIRVTFAVPCHPRTEQLVSRQLGLTRRQARDALDQGLVRMEDGRAVPKRLTGPSVLLVDLDRIAAHG